MGREYQADLKPIRDEFLSELNKLRKELLQGDEATKQEKKHQEDEHKPEYFISDLRPLRDELISELNKLRSELLEKSEQGNMKSPLPMFDPTDDEDEET